MSLADRTLPSAVTAFAASLAVAAAIPTASVAAGCVGRPGASALEQYCEAVPNAEGGRESPGSGNGAGGGVSKSTADKLASRGAEGAAVAALAGGGTGGSGGSGSQGSSGKPSSTRSPGSPKASATESGAGEAAAAVAAPADPSGNPLRATKEAIASGPTTGQGLVWGVVAMGSLGALSAVILRRRGLTPLERTDSDAPDAS